MRWRLLGLGLVLAVAAACQDRGDAPRRADPATAVSSPSAAVSAAPAPRSDWPTYHRTLDRAGLSPDFPPVHALSRGWARNLDGRVYASPIVGRGRLFVATEHNTIYALDPETGRVLWQRHLGEPVPQSALPCGNIDPLGITGTPVYDPVKQRLYAVAELHRAGHVRHDLFGLDATTGRIVLQRSADPPRQDPTPMQQRAALALVNGVVYAAYGGLAGDCGDYHGHVVGLPVNPAEAMTYYRVPVTREGGIWAPSGPALRRDGRLLVAVGNGESTGTYDGSDSVLALSLPDLRRVSFFAPRTWAQENSTDSDLGSMGPAPLADGRVVQAGKSADVYLLSAGNLGGIGGELTRIAGCPTFGGAAVHGNLVYLPCTWGIRQIRVGPGDRLDVGWRANQAAGSPVIGGGVVFTLDTGNGDLYALDEATGRVRARQHVGETTRFATPALWGGYVLVGTVAGIVATRALS